MCTERKCQIGDFIAAVTPEACYEVTRKRKAR